MESVIIIEPHPVYRLGLRQLLSDTIPNASIRAIDYTALEQPPATEPDACALMLLSLSHSRCSVKLIDMAQRHFAPSRILLVTDEHDVPDFSALPECVAGSVAKQAPPEIFQASVQLVRAGGTCFPPRGASQPGHAAPVTTNGAGSAHVALHHAGFPSVSVAPSYQVPQGEFSIPVQPGSVALRESRMLGLTPRQYEVLMLLARGYPMKIVGRALNISVATAKAHTETLYQRLDVHNRNAAVYAAVSRGATLGWAHVPNTPPLADTKDPEPPGWLTRPAA